MVTGMCFFLDLVGIDRMCYNLLVPGFSVDKDDSRLYQW